MPRGSARAGAIGESSGTGAGQGSTQAAAIALVGFMGAGKSAVGLELAAAFGIPFVDTDQLIVATAGPIPALFADRGEAGFRALEAEVVTAAVRAAVEQPSVLALGGGAVLSDAVRGALEGLPHVVWLTATPEELWARVAGQGPEIRPLAVDEQAFRALLAGREPLYREVATLVIETTGRSAPDVAADLAAALSVGGPGTTGRRQKGGAR